MSENASVFSIWLIPASEDATYRRVAEEIALLTARYEGVPFEPHVTLLGGVQTTKEDMLQKTRDLATQLKVCNRQLLQAKSMSNAVRFAVGAMERSVSGSLQASGAAIDCSAWPAHRFGTP